MSDSGIRQKVLVRKHCSERDDVRRHVSDALEQALRTVGMIVQHGERVESDPRSIAGWFTQGLFVEPGVAEFSVSFRLGVVDPVDGGRAAEVVAFVSEPVVVSGP